VQLRSIGHKYGAKLACPYEQIARVRLYRLDDRVGTEPMHPPAIGDVQWLGNVTVRKGSVVIDLGLRDTALINGRGPLVLSLAPNFGSSLGDRWCRNYRVRPR